jgi:enoyl-CoA hydratase/carnithine racemase
MKRGYLLLYETIRTELRNGIMTVFLNRPDNLNVYTHQMSEELIQVYQKANNDDDVRVIIVTGEGKAFCAGMDLSEIAKEIAEHTAATSNSFVRQLLWKIVGRDHPYESHLAESKFLYWAGNNQIQKKESSPF